MMNLNRKLAPKTYKTTQVALQKPVTVSDKHSFFLAEDKSFGATKVELLYKAGSKFETKRLAAKMCAELLMSGTKDKSLNTIANEIDQLGGFVRVEPSKDYLMIQIFGLVKNMPEILDIALDAVDNVVFPESEFNEQLSISKSAFIQSIQKVETLSRRAFYKNIYKNSAYENIADLEDFDLISREDVLDFHNKNCHKKAPAVFVSGGYSSSIKSTLDDYLASFELPFENVLQSNITTENVPFKVVNVEKEGAIQNAIRLGRKMWTRQHEDYVPFTVLNTVLGGYFGSRLMNNIREDKGYTYGIGSYYISLQEMGVWGIATEVGSENAFNTFTEIERELDILRNDLISEEELTRVKNYMVGQFLSGTDGTFAVMEQFKSLWLNGVGFDSLSHWLAKVDETNAEMIKELANKYFNIENMLLVNSGVSTTFR